MSLFWYEEQSKWNKSSQVFSPLTHSEHQTKAKTQIKKKFYALVAVRRWLLHADQGKELLTTSNVFTVCLLSADCRHPEKSTWHAIANARTKWLLRKTNPQLYSMTNTVTQVLAHTSAQMYLLFSCKHGCTNPHTHTYTLTYTWSPADKEYLIKTPDSSKPFAVTFCCRSRREKKLFLKNTANLWWALRVEANSVECSTLASMGISKSYIPPFQLLTSPSHCWFSYLLMHNMNSSKQNTDDY